MQDFQRGDEEECYDKAVQEPGLAAVPASSGEQVATGIKSELVQTVTN